MINNVCTPSLYKKNSINKIIKTLDFLLSSFLLPNSFHLINESNLIKKFNLFFSNI
jgi:hypothetical protein